MSLLGLIADLSILMSFVPGNHSHLWYLFTPLVLFVLSLNYILFFSFTGQSMEDTFYITLVV